MQSFNKAVEAARMRQVQALKDAARRDDKQAARRQQKEARKLAKLTKRNAKKLELMAAFADWMLKNGFQQPAGTKLTRSVSLYVSPGGVKHWCLVHRPSTFREYEHKLDSLEGHRLLKRISTKVVADSLAEMAAMKGWVATKVDFQF